MQTEAEYFREYVPLKLRRDILRVVVAGCLSAFHQSKARDRDFFHDAVPALRRLEVEPGLSKLILPRGFDSTVIRTPSTNYTQISSPRVVLTAVTRDEPVAFVKPYRYRETLARSRQVLMFEPAEPPATDAKLFGLLVYGGPHKAPLPTLAEIVFPDPNGAIVSDGLDLIAEHPEILAQYAPTSEEAARAEPKLRKKPAAKQG
jgi:hypothetical protein